MLLDLTINRYTRLTLFNLHSGTQFLQRVLQSGELYTEVKATQSPFEILFIKQNHITTSRYRDILLCH